MVNKLKDGNLKLTKEEVYQFLSLWLNEQVALSHRETMEEESFLKPAWAEYQAYQLGMQKAYSKMLNLIPDQGKNV